MIRITINRDAQRAVEYYASSLTKENYFFKGNTRNTDWVDQAVKRNGSGWVSKNHLGQKFPKNVSKKASIDPFKNILF